MHELRLRKGEKLRHKLLIDRLFSKGSNLYEYPLRLTWNAVSTEDSESGFKHGFPSGVAPLQFFVSIPKKKRRHAVDRVLMRRRVREAYRLNRISLKELIDSKPELRTVSLAFIYLSSNNKDYQTIEKKMCLLLEKLSERLCKGDIKTQE